MVEHEYCERCRKFTNIVEGKCRICHKTHKMEVVKDEQR